MFLQILQFLANLFDSHRFDATVVWMGTVLILVGFIQFCSSHVMVEFRYGGDTILGPILWFILQRASPTVSGIFVDPRDSLGVEILNVSD